MVGSDSRHTPDVGINESQYVAYMSVCETAVPYWARRHQDFEAAAHAALVEVLSTYDPSGGVTVESCIFRRARSRIPTLLARSDQNRSNLVALEALGGLSAGVDGAVGPDTAAVWESTYGSLQSVGEFAALLPRRQREVALLIASGLTVSDVASTLGVTLSAICNSLRAMRPRALAYFDFAVVNDYKSRIAA